MENKGSVSIILLSGGFGKRSGKNSPKQYEKIRDRPIIQYSFECFSSLSEVTEIVVVCHEEYRDLFRSFHTTKTLTFAEPGERRQDSVYNGLNALQYPEEFVCVHDGARPFITPELVRRVCKEAFISDASAAAMPLKYTIKEIDESGFVIQTPDREKFREIQTPQVIKTQLLKKGFDYVLENNLTVTDDVSIIESLGLPVKLAEGDYNNIKITTPEDFNQAENICDLLFVST